MQLMALPAPTEFLLSLPDWAYALFWSLPALMLAILEISSAGKSRKIKANIAGLVGVVLAFGFFVLAFHMPLHAIQKALQK